MPGVSVFIEFANSKVVNNSPALLRQGMPAGPGRAALGAIYVNPCAGESDWSETSLGRVLFLPLR